MKKMLAILLTFSLLMMAVAALAEDNGSVQNQMPAANGSEPFHGGGRPEDVPEPPNGEKPEDAPEPPTGEKPDAAPEKPTGEKPEDAPAEPEDSQANGEKPNAAPASPDGGNANNRKPAGEMPMGQMPEGQAPEMPDWDKLVTEGVISEKTAAKLKAPQRTAIPSLPTQRAHMSSA
jgi:hypothetical protein